MGRLAVLFIIAVFFGADTVYGLSCRTCSEVDCKSPDHCKYGLVKEVCGCCDACAQGPGESCQGVWGILGKCGEGYVCDTSNGANEMPTPPGYPQNFLPGVCVDAPRMAAINGPRASYGRPRGSASSGLLGNRRAGQAKKMSTKHKYRLVGSSIPPNIAALLASQNGGRAKRSTPLVDRKRIGGAKLQPIKHKHIVSGGIPAKYAALLADIRRKKPRGKRAILRWMAEALNQEA